MDFIRRNEKFSWMDKTNWPFIYWYDKISLTMWQELNVFLSNAFNKAGLKRLETKLMEGVNGKRKQKKWISQCILTQLLRHNMDRLFVLRGCGAPLPQQGKNYFAFLDVSDHLNAKKKKKHVCIFSDKGYRPCQRYNFYPFLSWSLDFPSRPLPATAYSVGPGLEPEKK